MKTLHVQGKASEIDLTDAFSDNYDYFSGNDFPFDENGEAGLENIFFRFYECNQKCSLDEAIKGYVETLCGKLEAEGQCYGYSEYTIEGFNISSLKLGGHDIGEIIKSKGDKYLHILIDEVPRQN